MNLPTLHLFIKREQFCGVEKQGAILNRTACKFKDFFYEEDKE
jgi:hypothetical protein